MPSTKKPKEIAPVKSVAFPPKKPSMLGSNFCPNFFSDALEPLKTLERGRAGRDNPRQLEDPREDGQGHGRGHGSRRR
jgi:hypothetical protein